MFADALPPIRIPAADHARLRSIATQALAERHPVASFLLAELARAEVCADELPADTVGMNGWVTYRLDTGWPAERRILVYPQDYAAPDLHLSVMSPLGAALLGLQAGSLMPYLTVEGLFHLAKVEGFAPPTNVAAFRPRPPSRPAAGDEGPPDPGPHAA